MLAEAIPPHDEFTAFVDELARIHGELDERAVNALLQRLSLRSHLLSSFERFNAATYQRNRIFRSEYLDLLLLCWKPGQRTPVHDHSGSTCGVYVVRGEGTEIAFDRSASNILIPSSSKPLTPGDITVSCDSDIHLVGNFCAAQSDLVTLHCYSPPLTEMKVYNQSETFLADDEEVREKAAASGCYQIQLS